MALNILSGSCAGIIIMRILDYIPVKQYIYRKTIKSCKPEEGESAMGLIYYYYSLDTFTQVIKNRIIRL